MSERPKKPLPAPMDFPFRAIDEYTERLSEHRKRDRQDAQRATVAAFLESLPAIWHIGIGDRWTVVELQEHLKTWSPE